jgi:hypothetical protein
LETRDWHGEGIVVYQHGLQRIGGWRTGRLIPGHQAGADVQTLNSSHSCRRPVHQSSEQAPAIGNDGIVFPPALPDQAPRCVAQYQESASLRWWKEGAEA